MVVEACRWSTGQRGPAVEPEALVDVDLSPYVRQALSVGVQAIAAAGSSQDKQEFQQLVDELGARTGKSAEQAAEATTKVVTEASRVIQETTREARLRLDEAQQQAGTKFAESVRSAQTALQHELVRLFGGDDPELVNRLNPVLASFDAQLERTTRDQTQTMIERAGACSMPTTRRHRWPSTRSCSRSSRRSYRP